MRRGLLLLLLVACTEREAAREDVDAAAPDAAPPDAGVRDGRGPAPPPEPAVPTIGACWQIAGVPDLGPFDAPGQEPVDFAIWPAADGTWQLWSCIRATKEDGNTRLFHRWEGARITDANWTPKGIAMRAGHVTLDGAAPNDGTFDPSFGEAQGGLQAPYVWSDGTIWHMLYGTWGNVGEQTSTDGKTFTRVLRRGNDVTIFDPAADGKRDPMLLPIAGVDHLYFTAHGSVFLSTSADGKTFSTPKVVASGGAAGNGGSSAECPFVVSRADGYHYLFRTSSPSGDYQPGVTTYVYASRDPEDFGIDDDSHLVARLPIAAPEIHRVDGADYIAHLVPSVQGIEVCSLTW